jgi:hypothetical protein
MKQAIPFFLKFLLFVFLTSDMFAQSHYPGQHAGKFAIEDKLIPKLYSFDLQDINCWIVALNKIWKENNSG